VRIGEPATQAGAALKRRRPSLLQCHTENGPPGGDAALKVLGQFQAATPASDLRVRMTSIQFLIPHNVADTLPIGEVAARSRAAGLAFGHVEYSTVNARGSVRVTCSEAMGVFLIEDLKALAEHVAEKGDGQLLIEIARAINAVFTAIEKAGRPGASMGTEPTPH
jgi:hypothetical protein